jgi:hypothetical protein
MPHSIRKSLTRETPLTCQHSQRASPRNMDRSPLARVREPEPWRVGQHVALVCPACSLHLWRGAVVGSADGCDPGHKPAEQDAQQHWEELKDAQPELQDSRSSSREQQGRTEHLNHDSSTGKSSKMRSLESCTTAAAAVADKSRVQTHIGALAQQPARRRLFHRPSPARIQTPSAVPLVSQ